MTDGAVRLSLAAVDLLWEHLNLGSPLVVFQVPSVGETLEERATMRAEVLADLARRGLARRDEVAGELVDNLALLADAPLAIEALGMLDGGRRLCARAVSDGRFAVLAVRNERSVRVDRIRPTALIPAMLELIGTAAPGPGRSVSYPAAPDPPDERPDGLLRRDYAESTPFDGQRRQAQAILGQKRTQAGFFVVLSRDHLRPETMKPALLWFDTAAGRYLGHTRPGPDGRTWTTYAPADNNRLAQHLADLLTR